MPSAEIIAIGTELLLGEIQDTNTRHIARVLRDAGVDLYRTMVVGDNANRIAGAIQEALQRSQIIITTGGLGPTVDDPTRQAVALAFGVDTEFRPELWEQILARFQRYGRKVTENNKRQAYIPCGALPVENPVGTAPAFIYETETQAVISLPGVPKEMEYLIQNAVMPYLRERFDLKGTIKARVLHTASMGESQVDDVIGDMEVLYNPTVGLLAHPGQCDIRITAKADSLEKADELIEPLVRELYARLGENIFGEDGQTLEGILSRALEKRGWEMAAVEAGLSNQLAERIKTLGGGVKGIEILPSPLDPAGLHKALADLMRLHQVTVGLGASLFPHKDKQEVKLLLLMEERVEEETRYYGGPPQNSPTWAANLALDWARRKLQ